MTLHILINLDNAAFIDGPGEVHRILDKVGDHWYYLDCTPDIETIALYDTNGNVVGKAWTKDDTLPLSDPGA